VAKYLLIKIVSFEVEIEAKKRKESEFY